MPAVPPETDVVEYRLRVAAQPETVFTYFTDPEKMVRWLGEEATLDPRPGGACRIVFRPSEASVASAAATFLGRDPDPKLRERNDLGVMTGRYVEVDPYRRIALSWGWELELLAVPPQSTLVEVTFTPDGEHTIVEFSHRRLPASAIDFHRAGWDHYLARLAVVAEGDDPGPDPWSAQTAG